MTRNDENQSNIPNILDEIEDICDRSQKTLTDKAQRAGYARSIFREMRPEFEKAGKYQFSKTEETLTKYRNYLSNEWGKIKALPDFDTTAISVASSSLSSVSADYALAGKPSFSMPESFKPILNIGTPDRNEMTASLLGKLHPELERGYLSIWETYYGTTKSKTRNALFAIRQVFDHLFDVLAPEKKVIEFLNINLQNNITRKDKLIYTAKNHVKDDKWADVLISQADEMIETYNKLNVLHKRGTLDEQTAENSLFAMREVIEQWVKAIGLKPPFNKITAWIGQGEQANQPQTEQGIQNNQSAEKED